MSSSGQRCTRLGGTGGGNDAGRRKADAAPGVHEGGGANAIEDPGDLPSRLVH